MITVTTLLMLTTNAFAAMGDQLRQYDWSGGSARSVAFNSEYVLVGGYPSDAEMFNRTSSELVCVFTGHTDIVNDIVIFAGDVFTGSDDNTLKRWALNSSCALISSDNPHGNKVSAIEVRGAYMFTAGYSAKTIFQWDENMNKLKTMTTVSTIWSLTVTTDATTVYVGCSNNKAYEFDVASETITHTYGDSGSLLHTGDIREIHVDDNGILYTGGESFEMRTWDVNTNHGMISEFSTHTDKIKMLNKFGSILLSGSNDNHIKFWNATDPANMVELLDINFGGDVYDANFDWDEILNKRVVFVSGGTAPEIIMYDMGDSFTNPNVVPAATTTTTGEAGLGQQTSLTDQIGTASSVIVGTTTTDEVVTTAPVVVATTSEAVVATTSAAAPVVTSADVVATTTAGSNSGTADNSNADADAAAQTTNAIIFSLVGVFCVAAIVGGVFFFRNRNNAAGMDPSITTAGNTTVNNEPTATATSAA